MRKLLQTISIIVFIIACNSNEHELQKAWIGKYSLHRMDTENETESKGPRGILEFGEDDLVMKNFYFDFMTDDNNISVVQYDLTGDILAWTEPDGPVSFHCSVSEDSLSLRYKNDNPREAVFERLPKYRLARKKSELDELLLYSSFKVFDSVRVEFRDNSTLIMPNFFFHLGDNQFWMIDTYEDELFLVIDGMSGMVLHIKKIHPEGFSGTLYGRQNKDVLFQKILHEVRFNIDELLGEWIAISDKSIAPPAVQDQEREYFNGEQLMITDTTIRRSLYYAVDTMSWETNRERDLILLPDLDLPVLEKKWRIITLNEKELVVERMRRFDSQIERIRFERK